MDWLSDLCDENPWWRDPGAIEADRLILAWEKSRFRWMPPVIDDVVLDKDAVYTLRGARQIGKTTAVKLLVRALLGRGIRPQNILFYSCDMAGEARGLYDVIREYLRHRDREKSERTFVFLDDILIVEKWPMAVKRLWDMGMLMNCTVIATGSHAMGRARSAERLPGRRGRLNEAMDKVVHPLSFPEYVLLADASLAEKIRPALDGGDDRDRHLDSLLSGKILPSLRSLSKDIGALNRHLDDYAASGGIPWIADQLGSRRTVPEDSYATCMDPVLGDMAALRLGPEGARGIAAALTGSIGRPVSGTSIAKDVGLPSATHALSYVSALENMFILSVMYQYNAKTKSTMPGKAKKIHFADPLYFHTLRGWTASTETYPASKKFLRDDENFAHVAEGIVGSHLIRMAFRRSPKKPWFLYTNYLAYWKYGPGKEVDFVYNDGNVEVPIEVKLGRSPNKRDLDGIIAFKRATGTKNGLLLTRSALSAERECVKVPAALFLLLA